RAIQSRVGLRERVEAIGRRIIQREMPEEHRVFFEQLPFIVVGTKDPAGQPWATILSGPPGFVTVPTPSRIEVSAEPAAGDPALEGLEVGATVALLGIELHSRARIRANGRVRRRFDGGFSVEIEQTFGNCPKYIQSRHIVPARPPGGEASAPYERGHGLIPSARTLIASADTFFIATSHPGGGSDPAIGMDVSHRGGRPGFIRIDGDVLTVPDFVGNYLFNTLGNLVLEPRAGLVFPDFSTGDLIQISADTEIVWDGSEVDGFAGAARLLRFHVRETVRRKGQLDIRETGIVEPSPFLARTGSWHSAGGAKEPT
ncbi:MAG: pyridoxamine 5'-phosphate oxidase family protein, partial [Caulobacteraceae bacterium]